MGMREKDNLFLQKIRFLASDNPYFGELAGIAKEMGGQNLPVLVTSPDLLFRNFFSETVAFCRFKESGHFEKFDALKSENLVSKIQQVKNESVIFIDRIECLSVDLQSEILEMIENGFFESRKILFIAGSETSIEESESNGRLSAKLAFRLGLVKVNILSLNEIKNGAVTIAWILLNDANSHSGKDIKGFSESALEEIQNHFWRAGVFELKSVIDFAVSVCESEYISLENLPFGKADSGDANTAVFNSLGEDKSMKTALDSFKRYYVTKILEENGNNQTRAAKVLGLQRTYVSRLLNELQIR